jgi:predicted AAA+ superfamily ATPase
MAKKKVQSKKTSENATIVKSKKKAKTSEVWKNFFLAIWWIIKGLWWLIKSFFKGIYWLSEKMVSFAYKEKSIGKGKLKSKDIVKIAKLTVLETQKGTFSNFLTKLKTSDSMIGIIVGARGSGKSAIAMSILENLKGGKKKFFAMGFQSKDLPDWIQTIEKVDDIENDSYVIIDEGGILFSSRDSMSNSNKLLSELLFIARHKNLTILFISQNSSNIEINTIRQADFIILKKSSLLQKDFERKKIAEIYTEYADGFEKYKNYKGLTLIYSDLFVGYIDNELPSFWSTNISKGFRDTK